MDFETGVKASNLDSNLRERDIIPNVGLEKEELFGNVPHPLHIQKRGQHKQIN